jgi:hypothetical protein
MGKGAVDDTHTLPRPRPEQLVQLEELDRSTRNERLRTRAQMVLLAAGRGLTAAQIAEIVRAAWAVSVADPLAHRFGPRRNYVNVLSSGTLAARVTLAWVSCAMIVSALLRASLSDSSCSESTRTV